MDLHALILHSPLKKLFEIWYASRLVKMDVYFRIQNPSFLRPSTLSILPKIETKKLILFF